MQVNGNCTEEISISYHFNWRDENALSLKQLADSRNFTHHQQQQQQQHLLFKEDKFTA